MGIVAVHIKQSGSEATYGVTTDYLGSIRMLTSIFGQVIEEHSYDSWGNHRNKDTWQLDTLPDNTLLFRGYTGHEHMPEFGLINMNGRLYDPVIGRMLSPDNNVQSPNNSQNYNRYSYVLNNPLKYTDPDGENPLLIAMVYGAAISAGTHIVSSSLKGQDAFQGLGFSMLTGALGGAASFGIGGIASGLSGAGKFAFQTVAHGTLGGAMNVIGGGEFATGFIAGGIGSVAGGIATKLNMGGVGITVVGAFSGGAGSYISGGEFWDGFRNGAISAGLNHSMHKRDLQVSEGTEITAEIINDIIADIPEGGSSSQFMEIAVKLFNKYENAYVKGSTIKELINDPNNEMLKALGKINQVNKVGNKINISLTDRLTYVGDINVTVYMNNQFKITTLNNKLIELSITGVNTKIGDFKSMSITPNLVEAKIGIFWYDIWEPKN